MEKLQQVDGMYSSRIEAQALVLALCGGEHCFGEEIEYQREKAQTWIAEVVGITAYKYCLIF